MSIHVIFVCYGTITQCCRLLPTLGEKYSLSLQYRMAIHSTHCSSVVTRTTTRWTFTAVKTLTYDALLRMCETSAQVCASCKNFPLLFTTCACQL